MSRFLKQVGLLKSIAIYYWKPFNQRRLREFYSQFISEGDLCFDIGAHVGNRTWSWYRLGAYVIAVEPQSICFKYLERRFSENGRIRLINEAVGAMIGEATLYVNSANPAISTLSHAGWRNQLARDARYPVTWDDEENVRLTTLDVLIEMFGIPKFCKLDVENNEFEALLGLSAALPMLSFEYYPPAMDNCFRCLARLADLGSYEFNWSFGENLRLQSRDWLTQKEITQVLRTFTTRREYGDIYARLAM